MVFNIPKFWFKFSECNRSFQAQQKVLGHHLLIGWLTSFTIFFREVYHHPKGFPPFFKLVATNSRVVLLIENPSMFFLIKLKIQISKKIKKLQEKNILSSSSSGRNHIWNHPISQRFKICLKRRWKAAGARDGSQYGSHAKHSESRCCASTTGKRCLRRSERRGSWLFSLDVSYTFISYVYQHLPRGAEWMVRGAYTTSLRVLTAPFGRYWYINIYIISYRYVNIIYIYMTLSLEVQDQTQNGL